MIGKAYDYFDEHSSINNVGGWTRVQSSLRYFTTMLCRMSI